MSERHLFAAERLAVALAVAALCVAAGWPWHQRAGLHRLRREPIATALSGEPYARAEFAAVPAMAEPWAKPVPQSAGGGWVYELFAPPPIYYDATVRAFAVSPPVAGAERTGTVFGLELLAVKREPFRLQLVGYVGTPGDYLAAFVSEQTPETLFGRAGRRFDRLGLALKSFEIRRGSGTPARPAAELTAVATLLDERAGGEVTLDNRGLKLTDTPVAVLRVGAANPAKPRVLRQGEAFEQDDATYRIEHIQLDPPEVVVAKHVAGLPFPETRVLRPAEARETASTGSVRRFQDATAAPGVASHRSRP